MRRLSWCGRDRSSTTSTWIPSGSTSMARDSESSEFLLAAREDVGDLRGLGDVERKYERALGVTLGEIMHRRDVARGDHGASSASEDELRKLTAEAGGAAGDQPDRTVSIHHG